MVVMKFGGTSVADQSAMERLIAIVRAQRQADAQQEGGDARGPIVVVSALMLVATLAAPVVGVPVVVLVIGLAACGLVVEMVARTRPA